MLPGMASADSALEADRLPMGTRVLASNAVLLHKQDWWFPVPRSQLWAQLERFELYPSWWSWLREFDVEGSGLVAGIVMRGLVEPPVPYPFRVTVTIVDASPPAALTARLEGDVTGSASMRLEEVDGQTCVGCMWTLRMNTRNLRVAARLAAPVMRWGHDRVVERTVRSFAANALGTTPRAPRSC